MLAASALLAEISSGLEEAHRRAVNDRGFRLGDVEASVREIFCRQGLAHIVVRKDRVAEVRLVDRFQNRPTLKLAGNRPRRLDIFRYTKSRVGSNVQRSEERRVGK